MAAIQSAFNMFRPALGLRLLVIHRVARHSAAFRVTEGFAKYFSDTVTHTGQVSGVHSLGGYSWEGWW